MKILYELSSLLPLSYKRTHLKRRQLSALLFQILFAFLYASLCAYPKPRMCGIVAKADIFISLALLIIYYYIFIK